MSQIKLGIPESWLEQETDDPAVLNELRIFRKQEWLERKRQEIRSRYEDKLEELLQEHYDAQIEIIENFQGIHYEELEKYGILETRKRAIPAYTLDRFQELPMELRLRIWSFASRTTEPETINICGVDHREADTFSLYDDDPPRKSSSVVEYIEEYLPTGRRTVPSVLQICRESRSVAQQVYTRMALSTYDATHQEIYVNTLYDKFFIGGLHGKSWKSYMILVDLFIKLHSSRPLRRQIQRDVEKLQNIRFLTVEFNIFATAPARLWAEFPKLEQIVIAIFPYATISDFEPRSSRHHTRFKSIRPQRGTMYGKRAAWLVEHAEKALNKVKADDVPQWNIPRIEVVMRKTGEEIDDEIVEEWTDDPVEYSDEDDDDSTWYAQAEAKMNRAITKKEISWLKQKHHLSKKVLYPDRHPGKDTGDWIEDSETEEGLAHRPYDYEQCDN